MNDAATLAIEVANTWRMLGEHLRHLRTIALVGVGGPSSDKRAADQRRYALEMISRLRAACVDLDALEAWLATPSDADAGHADHVAPESDLSELQADMLRTVRKYGGISVDAYPTTSAARQLERRGLVEISDEGVDGGRWRITPAKSGGAENGGDSGV